MTNQNRKYTVDTSIQINASRQKVWSVLQDFANVAVWAPSVSQSYQIGKVEKGVGHGRHCEIEGFGGLDEIITKWEENNEFEYQVTPLGPLTDSLSTWTIKDVGDGKSCLDINLKYGVRFSVFGKLIHAVIMRNKLQQSLNDAGRAVKSRVESLNKVKPINKSASAA